MRALRVNYVNQYNKQIKVRPLALLRICLSVVFAWINQSIDSFGYFMILNNPFSVTMPQCLVFFLKQDGRLHFDLTTVKNNSIKPLSKIMRSSKKVNRSVISSFSPSSWARWKWLAAVGHIY